MGERSMNEDFFSTFRESPRPEFTQTLYQRLATQTEGRGWTHRNFSLKRIVLVFTALIVMVALVLAVSPAARAAVDEIITEIIVRGTTVFISKDVPDYSTFPEVYESYSVIWRPVTPEEISAEYPFFAKLPTWVPSGYVLQERAALYYWDMHAPPSFSIFQWKNDDGELIQLEVNKGSCPNGPFYESGTPRSDCAIQTFISVGIESEPRVIAVHDQPGVMIRVAYGFADLSGSVREWNPYRGKASKDPTKGISLIWENDGRTFQLIAESATITQEALIRIAESIP
jgi:hypothetical protein